MIVSVHVHVCAHIFHDDLQARQLLQRFVLKPRISIQEARACALFVHVHFRVYLDEHVHAHDQRDLRVHAYVGTAVHFTSCIIARMLFVGAGSRSSGSGSGCSPPDSSSYWFQFILVLFGGRSDTESLVAHAARRM